MKTIPYIFKIKNKHTFHKICGFVHIVLFENIWYTGLCTASLMSRYINIIVDCVSNLLARILLLIPGFSTRLNSYISLRHFSIFGTILILSCRTKTSSYLRSYLSHSTLFLRRPKYLQNNIKEGQVVLRSVLVCPYDGHLSLKPWAKQSRQAEWKFTSGIHLPFHLSNTPWYISKESIVPFHTLFLVPHKHV